MPVGFESSLAKTSFRQRSNFVTGSQEYRDSSEDTKVNRSRAEDWQNPSEKSATTLIIMIIVKQIWIQYYLSTVEDVLDNLVVPGFLGR